MKKVLVVDDEPFSRMFFKHLIEENTHLSVIEAADGLEALEKMKKEPVSLVVLDINMPKLSGEATVKEMKKDINLADIPVLVITQLDPDVYQSKFKKLQVNGFFSKLEIVDKKDSYTHQRFMQAIQKEVSAH